MKIFPPVASVNLEIHLNNVDFPEPDKPITTNISPFETSKEALFTPTMHPFSWNVFASTLPFASWSIFLAFEPKILYTESHLITVSVIIF